MVQLDDLTIAQVSGLIAAGVFVRKCALLAFEGWSECGLIFG